MFELVTSIWSNDLYYKLILTAIIILGQTILFRLLVAVVTQRIPEDSLHIYTIRKAISYSVSILGAILVLAYGSKA